MAANGPFPSASHTRASWTAPTASRLGSSPRANQQITPAAYTVRTARIPYASQRAAAIADMCASLGGSLESFHFAFGNVDAFVICDLPDDEAAAAAAFSVGASAATQVTTIKLLTLEEADAAISRSVGYRPPGS